MQKTVFLSLGLIFTLAIHSLALAESEKVIAASGTSQVSLLELYSSESCSSCPPADQWISKFESDKNLWTKSVPIVFHVDYWNHLNWKDKFSSSQMTARQIAISKTWERPAVYTPGVVFNGNEWSTWRQTKLINRLSKDSSNLSLKIIQNSDGKFRVQVSGQKPGSKYTVHIAKLGFGILTKVTDGENAGSTLSHSFVVLDWQNQVLGAGFGTNPLKFASHHQKAKKYAVVAWIEEHGRPIPLQATGAYL